MKDSKKYDDEATGHKEMIQRLHEQELNRSSVYRYLSDAFGFPSPGLPKVGAGLHLSLQNLGYEAQEDARALLRACEDGPGISELRVEYTRLFLGPFLAPAPPYGSVYLEKERQMMGASTIDARKQYFNMGLDLSPDFKDAPDHICAELEFMQALVFKSLQAVNGCDYPLLSENIMRQRTFLKNHLGAWVSEFAHRVVENARMDFYCLAASIARIFVMEDLHSLSFIEEKETDPSLHSVESQGPVLAV